MNRSDCAMVVGRVFEGTREVDNIFHAALRQLGMTAEDFFRFRTEARRQERRLPRCCLLTPTGAGKNR